MCVFTGGMVSVFGSDAFVWLLGGFALLRAWTAYRLPKMRARAQPRLRTTGFFITKDLRAALSPWIVLPLVSGAILFATHMVMNGFSALVWKHQGLSESIIAILIGLGALAEAGTMFIWSRLEARFAARSLLLIAAAAAVVRWSAMALSPPATVLIGLQLLQGITFTFGYLGCLYFVAKRTDEGISAEAQGVFAMMQQGASILIVAGFGLLFERAGVAAFWSTWLVSLFAAALICLSLRMQTEELT